MMNTGLRKVQMKQFIYTVFFIGLLSCFLVFSTQAKENQAVMKIRVEANGQSALFELNTSPAAKELYVQLPLNIEVEEFGGKEKIFYPPQKLSIADTPLVVKAKAGTLAYYAPWGDVVIFYKEFGSAPGLYELGHAISGKEHIQMMSGSLRITQEKQ
jgi:hypothetical protein